VKCGLMIWQGSSQCGRSTAHRAKHRTPVGPVPVRGLQNHHPLAYTLFVTCGARVGYHCRAPSYGVKLIPRKPFWGCLRAPRSRPRKQDQMSCRSGSDAE
jgi:hypothetical protein